MTTTPKPEKKPKQPSLAKRKRKKKKKSDTPTKAQIREFLGMKKDPKPRVNRKKFATDVIQKWDEKDISIYQLAQHISIAASYSLGRIKHKAGMKPDLMESNRITDEDMGILKLLNATMLLHERSNETQTYGSLFEVLSEGFLEESAVSKLERLEEGDSSDAQATE